MPKTTYLNFFKLQSMAKVSKKHFEMTKQSSRPDLCMTQTLELSDWECKITVINILKALMGNRQHVRIDEKCKQRGGN